MDIAQCTLDGIKYDIASFSNLDPGSLNKKRSQPVLAHIMKRTANINQKNQHPVMTLQLLKKLTAS